MYPIISLEWISKNEIARQGNMNIFNFDMYSLISMTSYAKFYSYYVLKGLFFPMFTSMFFFKKKKKVYRNTFIFHKIFLF